MKHVEYFLFRGNKQFSLAAFVVVVTVNETMKWK